MPLLGEGVYRYITIEVLLGDLTMEKHHQKSPKKELRTLQKAACPFGSRTRKSLLTVCYLSHQVALEARLREFHQHQDWRNILGGFRDDEFLDEFHEAIENRLDQIKGV